MEMARTIVTLRNIISLIAVVALCVYLCICYLSVEFPLPGSILYTTGPFGQSSVHIEDRLSKYCNAKPPQRSANNSKLEDMFELQYLVVNVRHGDRSSIHKIPGTRSTSNAHHPDHPKLIDNRTTDFAEKLKSFSLAALSNSDSGYNFEQNEEKDLKSAMNPKKILQRADFTLPPGQLTTRGFMQHIELGRLLHSAYGRSFLSKVSASHMYVRSTNYARTVQSVGALLIAMMPHLSNTKRRVLIHYHPHEADEIMHGLGARSSSHAITARNNGKEDAEKISSGGCEVSVRLAKQQEKAFVLDAGLRSELVNRLGDQVKTRPVGHMADALLPSYCHGRSLPCSAVEDKIKAGTSLGLDSFLRTRHGTAGDTGSHCLNSNDLAMIMAEADRQYCERFAGDQGGLNATKLSIFPFLREITQRVVTAALQGGDRKERLSVFSGHDTVIAPVLAGLGVYSGEHCIWPGYASNIVIELWHPKQSDAGGVKSGSGPSHALKKLLPKLWDTLTPKAPHHYAQSFVRVLFNGEDVTQRMPTCAAERAQVNTDSRTLAADPTLTVSRQHLAAIAVEGLSLCSLEALVAQVASLVEPHRSIEEACRAN